MGLISYTVNKTLDSSLSDEKKSFILSAIVYLLIILILFLIRFWPPSNIKELIGGGGGGGIEMNFGDSDYGLGDNFKSETLNVKDAVTKQVQATATDEQIISDENDDPENDVEGRALGVEYKCRRTKIRQKRGVQVKYHCDVKDHFYRPRE